MRIALNFDVPDEQTGKRLDQAVCAICPDYSRAQWQQWIKSGDVTVNGNVVSKTRHKVTADDHIEVNTILVEQGTWEAQPIPLDIAYEDNQLIIVNKPAGLVVHPGAGNPDSTLVNALRHYDENLVHIPRAGIIHRLDKETSGLLIVARTLESHHALTQALSEREIKREYQAIVHGTLISGATVHAPIDRHPTHRVKMAIRDGGRDAVTHYRLIEKFSHFTHIKCELESGRTHQIRVHMKHIGHPLVGDPLYGYGKNIPGKLGDNLRDIARSFPRQALHAWRLTLTHPTTGELLEVESTLPSDMQQLLNDIRATDT